MSDQAAVTLGKVGPGAIPALVQALNRAEHPFSLNAASALAKMGVPALTALIESLKYKDDYVLMCAAKVLGEMGPAAEKALPDLDLLQDHSSSFVRDRAKEAVEKIKGNVPPKPEEELS